MAKREKYEPNPPRTVGEFVEDMVLLGRTPKQIRMVARSTRWRAEEKEVFIAARRLHKRLRKKKKEKRKS